VRAAALQRHRRLVRLRVRASGPGLLRVRVKDRRGRVLAAGLVPVHNGGERAVRVATTRAGRRALRRRLAVRVSGTFRDLAAATVKARGRKGRLGG
jgi:hypothetical protein